MFFRCWQEKNDKKIKCFLVFIRVLNKKLTNIFLFDRFWAVLDIFLLIKIIKNYGFESFCFAPACF